MASTIKQKKGLCPECISGIEVPLISGFCKYHYWKKRSELKSKKPEKKQQKPIQKRSKKRQIEELKYQALRIEFLGKPENRKCPITGDPTTDIHHKKGRIGSLLLDARYWIALSRKGHRFVEENPEWAKENGYSLSRLAKE